MERGRAQSGRGQDQRQVNVWLRFCHIQVNCHRTPPVLPSGVFDVTSKSRESSSDLDSLKLKEEAQEQKSLDNIFFTFCCGDNLTCLKSSMVKTTSICHFIFIELFRYATVHLIVQMVKTSFIVKQKQRRWKSD